MFRYSLSWYIFTFSLLESIIKTHLTVHDSNHGFIGNNHRYFEEEMSSIHQVSGLGTSSNLNDVSSSMKFHLKFEPSFLDFKKRPLGIPHLEKVTLFNADVNRSIDMTSISGSTVHFHSSFFEDKKIPPLGNTTFNVVFLGREEGFVESSLFIHTNEGHFKYDVKGSSVFSPYRLRPIVGVKLPVNATFSPVIFMHNPHMEAIQILEVYSSGGEFHLELPSGELEGPKDMWEIPPLQTKAIIRVRFQAKTEQNHTAYVRIKLNNTQEVLVVPLEVEVTSSGGIFHPQGLIDFGIGGSLDPHKELELCVYNPLKKSVKIHSVTSTSKAVQIHFDHVKVQPDAKNENGCVKIGRVKIDWKLAYDNKDYSGKVIVKYKNGKAQTDIPYYLTVLEGGLLYSDMTTRYFVNDKSEGLSTRYFRIKNEFKSPVQLIGVSMPDTAQKYFNIADFKPLIVKPGMEADVFRITMKSGIKLADLKVTSHILLRTNVSDVPVPLLSYNGKLNLLLPFKTEDYQWDLGLLSLESKKEFKFLLYNTNPVSVEIKSIKSGIPNTFVDILGCDRGNYSQALLQESFKNLSQCDTLKPYEYAVVQLTIHTSVVEGPVMGAIKLITQYENLSIPFTFKAAPGKLEVGPDHLTFDHCFPGKICSHPLRIQSSFNDPMIVERIMSLPPDQRIYARHMNHILARSSKVIGQLYLDVSLGCNNECYTGLQHDTTAQWLRSLSLWKSVADFDLNLVNMFYNRYLNATSNGQKKWQNLTIQLDTTEVKGHIFHSRVKMAWPSLLIDHPSSNGTVFNFPLTQIGNTTYRNVTIKNPSSYNLIVQIVLDKHYPGAQTLFEGLPPNFLPPKASKTRTIKHNFFLHETYKTYVDDFKDMFDINVHEEAIPVLLYPGQNFTFTIGFMGEDTNSQSAFIFIRNNLTMIEVIRLNGQGSHPVFKFGNRKPGSSQPLVFELTDKHLKDCEREKQFRNPSPNLTVKRSFTARNTGEISIYVNNFYINGYPCEGYGFKVLNCGPFVLHPNSTKKVDIAFTPDLTVTKVIRTLVLDTSLGYQVNYTLHTTIPYQYLSICSNVIMRPEWEIYLSYVCTGLMFFFLVSILIIAFIDASRIRNQTVGVYVSPSNSSAHPILDLRLVGQQIRSEIRSSKSDTKASGSEGKSVPKIETISSDSEPSEQLPKVKSTVEKLVIVPTSGKAKKKLTKKNSNEMSVHDSHEQRKVNEVQKNNKPKPEEKQLLIEEKKSSTNAKKPVTNKKCSKAPLTVVPYEEETSSTTTESSSNTDEAEKENDQRNLKNCSKKNNTNNNSNNNNNKVSNCNPEEVTAKEVPNQVTSSSTKTDRRRLSQKNIQKNARADVHEKSDHHKADNRKNHKNTRERREKQALNKKLSEKTKSNENKNCDSRPNSTARVSPTISSNIWTENKASFSDVVARSDGNSSARPLTHGQTSKPTMYVEPYKQTTQQLGPIGSRRELWQDNETLGVSNNSSDEQTSRLSNSSFFSNAQDMPIDASQPYLDDLIGDTWAQQQSLMTLLEPNVCSTRQDTWNHCNSNINLNSYWNGNFNLLGNSVPVQQQQQQQPLNDQPGYLWGSSPVWAWAPPEAPRTPTRTPPGFDAVLQRNREEQRETYNPFTTSNIWTQPETYPWDYSQQ